jgi:hypothetical protein
VEFYRLVDTLNFFLWILIFSLFVGISAENCQFRHFRNVVSTGDYYKMKFSPFFLNDYFFFSRISLIIKGYQIFAPIWLYVFLLYHTDGNG